MFDVEAVTRAIEALLNYRQADDDGVMVITSRQAIHEVVDSMKLMQETWRSPAEVEEITQAAQREALEDVAKYFDGLAGIGSTMATLLRTKARALAPSPGSWQRVLEGFCVVPREPTDAMLDRMIEIAEIHDEYGEDKYVKNMGEVYRAMLAGEKP